MKSEINPIFIVGSPRSGTTLLRFMLSSHSRIYIPDETGFIPHLLKPSEVTKILSLDEVRSILARIGQLNYLWADLVDDIPTFFQNMPKHTLAHLLDQLFKIVVSRQDAIRWGDKTPLYVRHLPTLAKIFPQAQFIHVIRDGRDATLSAQKKWGLSQFWYQDNYYLLKNWADNVATGRRDRAGLPKHHYLEIHYELLVQSPEYNLRKICEFLGESYETAMLDYSHLAQQIGPGPNEHTEVMQPVSTDSVARWKFQMSTFDLKMSDRLIGSLLAEFGYDRYNPGNLTSLEWLKYHGFGIKYRFSDTLRKILYITGFLTLNRNMRHPSN